ncbi:alpha/beta hydrolase [Streptomyces sp. LUP30]|uniref:alpha/beta hydrolase n=1 Tax=Streptomyces sp. LUP30 TaxID=1890285 RepID=UPI000851B8BE|nr:alpha/beta hydrolase [Streptomyces sp. LUP30]
MDYDFDPELAPWAAKLPAVDYRDLDTARALLRAATGNAPAYEPEQPVEVTDRAVPGPPGAPAVAVRVYRPAGRTGPLPALLYLRWGGFVFGDLDSIHSTALRLADRVGAVVVSVGYRNAPEDPYPAALFDCYAALEWTVRSAAELGVDPDRIGVGGESAGGGLAAALTLMARDRRGPRLRFQCLFHPELDDRLDTLSARRFTDTPKWNRAGAELSWQRYLTGTAEPGTGAVPPLAAPARADDLRGLPPAFVMVCEFDPLRDEGIGYAHRLIQAGVRTELRHYPGTFHGSVAIDAEISRRMIADQVHALRQGLGA